MCRILISMTRGAASEFSLPPVSWLSVRAETLAIVANVACFGIPSVDYVGLHAGFPRCGEIC